MTESRSEIPPCSCGWPSKDCEQDCEYVEACPVYLFERASEEHARKVLGYEFDLLQIDQRADKEMSQ